MRKKNLDSCLTTYTKINGCVKDLSAKNEIIVFVENMEVF